MINYFEEGTHQISYYAGTAANKTEHTPKIDVQAIALTKQQHRGHPVITKNYLELRCFFSPLCLTNHQMNPFLQHLSHTCDSIVLCCIFFADRLIISLQCRKITTYETPLFKSAHTV